MATVQAVGRHRGTIRGIVGTIPGITILGGIGTIRSTIPHGMAGAILGITLLGIRLATTAITGIIAPMVATSAMEQAVACRQTCVTTIAETTTLTVRVVQV